MEYRFEMIKIMMKLLSESGGRSTVSSRTTPTVTLHFATSGLACHGTGSPASIERFLH